MPHESPSRRPRAFTLVEVMVSVLIVMTTAVGIAATIMYGLETQQVIRERNGATRLAAETLEITRRTFLTGLRTVDIDNVVVDDRGTPDPDDDVLGLLEMRFFDPAGNEVGSFANPIPGNQTMITAVATVTWTPAGRRGATQRSVTMSTLIAP